MFQEEKVKKRNQRDQDIDKQFNDIYKNQIYNNFIRKEKINKKLNNNINHLNINSSKKLEWKKRRTEDSYSNEKTTHINSITEIDNYEFKKSNTNINSSGINYSLIRKFNPKIKSECEIILNKENSKIKKKMVKLVLFNNCIFYYIKFNKTNFLYKKIIPIVNIFIHKKKIDDLTYVTFISQTHNTTTKRVFSCDDYEKVYNFCLKFNSFNCHRDITKDYYFKYELDKGKFGHVFLANKEDKKVAIKLVQKTDQSFEEYKINRNEIDIFHLLQNIKHKNIVECIDIYENESQIFFVFEYLSNGNLKKYIQDLMLFPKNYNVDIVLKLSLQLIEGMNILHKFGIIHRDIKTTNIMVKINAPIKKPIISSYTDLSEAKTFHEDISDVTLKIIDFGLSKILSLNETTNEPYGSLSYKAPELIMHKDYNHKVDSWSLGITIYYISYKMLPFEEGNREDVKNAIINDPVPYYANNILFDLNYLKEPININNKDDKEVKSSIVFSIIKDCLIKNPFKRYDIEHLYYKYCNFFK
jgi:tRNA A-37 threonylcarbamoyl transferase component Bud32